MQLYFRKKTLCRRVCNRTLQLGWIFALTTATLLCTDGCSSTGGQPPKVDPQAAAAFALEHYDANHDGAIKLSELSSCPALAVAFSNFDVDGDGRLVSEEITEGLARMYASRMSLTEMACTLTLDGRPLSGATVRLLPIEMLGDSIPLAEGITDDRGTARSAINAELIPDQFKQLPLMYPGLYRVEVTHAKIQLPTRYNSSTDLGCVVDPAARSGAFARFDLRSR